MEGPMCSSSDSLAQLASALAKAQIELVNPAKTLTGAIDRWGSGNEGQTYRYAPLSAGLDTPWRCPDPGRSFGSLRVHACRGSSARS